MAACDREGAIDASASPFLRTTIVAATLVFVSLGAADEGSPVTMDDPEIGRLLCQGLGLYVWPNHLYDGATVRVRLDCSFPDELREWISRAGQSGDPLPGYQWRLDVTAAGSRGDPLQTLTYPVTPGNTEATLDPASLATGLYRVQPSIVLPNGSSHRVWREPPTEHSPAYSIDRFLAVHDGPAPTVQSRIVDDPAMLTGLRLLGTPGGVQYPGSDADNCHGRSIRDLQLYRGEIHVGIGNGGPVDIWSFDPQRDPISFRREITVDEETLAADLIAAGYLLLSRVFGDPFLHRVLLGLGIKPLLVNFRHRFTIRTANSNVLSRRSFQSLTGPAEIKNPQSRENVKSSRPKDLRIAVIISQYPGSRSLGNQ